ncbi:YebC/PmpR family DNA-binding transcriptional regulator [Enterobacteriaceae endosymbiont of Macroplea appendiculata]|uniref:YebC/PmpR family DNA-binding transcriptional regulator n=1 Tax=Enterobacteriaceae endosymbiont of Macroplea appendiculata TaxID=2675790 RepID=UPI001449754A|nr:YebC/PmpR family DNA-binding transcriptional regulator [Enterobacteriaceae endosymbiont of Macroplea appendiculata]QJC31005.1 hypothetical protein GJT86_02110 [Enterobacteriaceae endosymbiont of Macroplea appendiculata]
MSGHSKWSNTRYRKAYQDAKKDKKFSKIIRELHSVVKDNNNANIYDNNKLKLVVNKALSYNMKRVTINKIITKYHQRYNRKYIHHNVNYLIYYGMIDRITLMIQCLTNNKNRTINFIRSILDKYHGIICNYSVNHYIFQQQVSLIYIINNNMDCIIDIAEQLMPNDIIFNKNVIEIFFSKQKYKDILILSKKFAIQPSEIKFVTIPYIKYHINDNIKQKLISIIYNLKSNVDIKKIYHNAIYI